MGVGTFIEGAKDPEQGESFVLKSCFSALERVLIFASPCSRKISLQTVHSVFVEHSVPEKISLDFFSRA